MKRYENNKTRRTIKFNDRSKKVYNTIIYPKIERMIEDIYVDIIVEDRLDNIAYQYYNDVTLWWIMAQANKVDRAANYGITSAMDWGIGKGSLFVEPGQRIRIPHPDRVGDILDEYKIMQDSRLWREPGFEENQEEVDDTSSY